MPPSHEKSGLERSHDKISGYSNPGGNHTAQQAGFSAEVASTARSNSEFKKAGSSRRVSRSEDAGLGSNLAVFDHVEIENGLILEGSGSQMKFIGLLPKNETDRLRKIDNQIKRIAGENGKQQRYLGHRLEVPTDQVDTYKDRCHKLAADNRAQALGAEKAGKPQVAERRLREAENCEQLAESIDDSGLTTEEAIEYRERPQKATLKDIAKNSHEAGLQGAQVGALIGLAVSTITNTYQILSDEKNVDSALKDVVLVTGASAATGYMSGAVGSALSASMQQSQKEAIRALAKSSIPSLIVSSTLTISSSVKALVAGEIDGTDFLNEIGEHGSGLLSSSMMSGVGQLAIPVPVVGALVGSMFGYTLSSIFYNELVASLNAANLSKTNYLKTKRYCEAVRSELLIYNSQLSSVLKDNFVMSDNESKNLLRDVNHSLLCGDSELLGKAINEFALSKGVELNFASKLELMDRSYGDFWCTRR